MASMNVLQSRTIVLCFDGTNEQFQPKNTNVVKFFSLLDKRSPNQQVYYQPGVGTYAAPGITGAIRKWVAKWIDEAIAWDLDLHVTDGYKFLMNNYTHGDRICMFGFSRGAYTARALAGMLHKVGLLPKFNEEQVSFAYNIYSKTGPENLKLAAEFKRTFSRDVTIEFVGCWETIASVGLAYSRTLPFTTDNSTIKRFRHALALDEHRARFQPNLAHRCSPSVEAASEDPEDDSYPISNSTQSHTDVLEVWFAGCHDDIGGGSAVGPPSLGNITLNWMIREVIESQCGIIFDADAHIPISVSNLSQMTSVKTPPDSNGTLAKDQSGAGLPSPLYSPAAAREDKEDAMQPLHDPLRSLPIWWILEFLPFHMSWQDEAGVWHRGWKVNFGRPREIPLAKPQVHISVKERMENMNMKYTPRAVWRTKPEAVWRY